MDFLDDKTCVAWASMLWELEAAPSGHNWRALASRMDSCFTTSFIDYLETKRLPDHVTFPAGQLYHVFRHWMDTSGVSKTNARNKVVDALNSINQGQLAAAFNKATCGPQTPAGQTPVVHTPVGPLKLSGPATYENFFQQLNTYRDTNSVALNNVHVKDALRTDNEITFLEHIMAQARNGKTYEDRVYRFADIYVEKAHSYGRVNLEEEKRSTRFACMKAIRSNRGAKEVLTRFWGYNGELGSLGMLLDIIEQMCREESM